MYNQDFFYLAVTSCHFININENVKSNHLKCIVSQCLSCTVLCVIFLIYRVFETGLQYFIITKTFGLPKNGAILGVSCSFKKTLEDGETKSTTEPFLSAYFAHEQFVVYNSQLGEMFGAVRSKNFH